jgi:hypothetical protein
MFATRSVSNGVSISSFPILKLLTHPEMERPAILNRSIPSTAGTTICIPKARSERPQIGQLNQSRDKAYNLHHSEGVDQMGSGFSQGHLY